MQFRPQAIFPSQGTLDIKLTAGVPVAQLSTQSPPMGNCHANCAATSVNVTITSIEVHTSGINNMTGMWLPVCTKQLTIDIIKLTNVTQLLCSTPIQPDTITNIRLTVSSVNALISGQTSPQSLTVPSGKLEIPIGQLVQIEAGKTTSVIVEFQPHIVEQGNGDYQLTPVLHAMTVGPA